MTGLVKMLEKSQLEKEYLYAKTKYSTALIFFYFLSVFIGEFAPCIGFLKLTFSFTLYIRVFALIFHNIFCLCVSFAFKNGFARSVRKRDSVD